MNTINTIAMRLVKNDNTSKIAIGTEKQLVEYIIKYQNDFQYFEKCELMPLHKSEVFSKVIVAVDKYTDETTLVYRIESASFEGALDKMKEMFFDIENAYFELSDVIYLSDNE